MKKKKERGEKKRKREGERRKEKGEKNSKRERNRKRWREGGKYRERDGVDHGNVLPSIRPLRLFFCLSDGYSCGTVVHCQCDCDPSAIVYVSVWR